MPKKEKLRVKKAYWKYFKNSPTVMKIINSRFWKRTQKAVDVCKCGNVGYKSLSKLAVKQANTILDLAHAVAAMEKSRTREKDELVRIRLDAVERLNNQRDTITSLQQEVADLEIIAKAREEVEADADKK